MQNNINKLLSFNEESFKNYKKNINLPKKYKNYFKDFFMDCEDRISLMIFEALYVSYMDILNTDKIDNYLDPLVLLSKNFEACYPKIKNLRNDSRVYIFITLFSDKSEGNLKNMLRIYNEYMCNSEYERVFEVIHNNKITIRRKKQLSNQAQKRFEVYLKLIRNELENIPYMYPENDTRTYTKAVDFDGSYDKTKTMDTGRSKIEIKGLEKKAIKTVQVSSCVRSLAEDIHTNYKSEGTPFDIAMYERIKEKQMNKEFPLSKININDPKMYDIGGHYKTVSKQLQIYPVKDEQVIKKINSAILISEIESQILGPTASGKSVTIEAMIYNLLLKGIRVLYVCSEVNQATKIMQKIMNLCKINNVTHIPTPFLSVGNDKFKYESSFIIDELMNNFSKKGTQSNSLTSFITDPINSEILRQLNSNCLLRGPLGFLDLDTTKEKKEKIDYKPCSELKSVKNGGKRWCHLYSQCGYHDRYKTMTEATLWVTTNASLLLSGMPPQWNEHKTTRLEAALINADVVLVDEADAIEVESDDKMIKTVCISKEKARGASDLNGSALLDAVISHSTYLPKSDKNNLINRMVLQAELASNIDKLIYKHIEELNAKNKEKIMKNFTIEGLAEEWLKEYTYKISKKSEKLSRRLLSERLKDINSYADEIEHVNLGKNASQDEKYLDVAKEDLDKIINKFVYSFEVDNKKMYKIKENSKEYDDYYYLFNIMICLNKLGKITRKEIFPYLSEFRYKLDNEPDALPIDNSLNNIISSNKHYQYTPDMPIDIAGYKYVYTNKRLQLEMTVSFGIGRDIMRITNRALGSLYNCRPAQIVYTSATSRAKDSSLYDIDVPVRAVIRNSSQDKQKINFFVERYIINSELECLSGTNIDEIDSKIEQFVSSYLSREDELLYKINKSQMKMPIGIGESTPITLIVTNSFKQANIVGNALMKSNWINEEDIAVLLPTDNNKFKKRNYHIKKEGLSSLYSKKVRFLIAPVDAISRAHNILRGPSTDKSLIRDIIFMFRPYPSPEDRLSTTSLIITLLKTKYVEDNLKADRYGYKALEYIEKESESMYAYLKDSKSWTSLSYDIRNVISANQLVSRVIQTIGRGRRGGTDVSVYFVDGAMSISDDEDLEIEDIINNELSMLHYWVKFLNKEDSITDALYKKLREGINSIQLNTHRF